MQRSFLKSLVFAALTAIGLTLAPNAPGQGITTASLSGFVNNKEGQAMAGATVTALHVPSGTQATTTTRANGQFNISGLRLGGPYTVTVNAQGYSPGVSSEVYLDQSGNAEQNFVLTSEVVQLEKLSVTGSRDGIFGSGKIGTSTTLNDRDIENVSSVRRNIQDIAQLDSRLYLGSLDQGGNLSAQGQNFRFNSLLVDGVQAIDTFGLNGNGFSSIRSPIPLEAIQSFSVDLAPYDVRRAGFTGALLNAVIKSGTNDFHGILYYEKSDQDWRQKNPLNDTREPFKERTFGFGVGGPLIKNKLFFYIHYDDFQRKSTAPQPLFVPNAAGQALVDQIIAKAKSYGYDPGTLGASQSLSNQKTKIAKIDWNISDRHRATFTYRQNNGEDTNFQSFASSGTTTSLNNFWFQQPRQTTSYTTQLFSQWTSDFRTEVDYSYTTYNGSPANHGTPFPQISVGGISGTNLSTGLAVTNGFVMLGTDSSRQLNFLNTKESQGKISGEYSVGDHTLTAGFEDIETKYNNAFVQHVDGTYTFSNTANWVAGTPPSAYQLALPFPGFTVNDAIAQWKYDAYAAFFQDSWKPDQQLTLLAGLRYDYPYVPNAPPVASGFTAAGFVRDNGIPVTRNNTTNSGNATYAPRIGFVYELKTEQKTQIRGGLGLFQGKSPAVWISNAYSNAGATASVTATSAQLPTIVFQPDVTKQPVPSGTPPTPSINVTDGTLKQPAVWKSNLAVDRALRWGGLTATVEFYYIQVDNGLNTEFLNYAPPTSGATTLPDGRIRFKGNPSATTTSDISGRRRVAAFADVFILTNTNKGYADGTSLELKRPMKDHWAWSASYTRSHATEVSPMTSSVAGSNYSARAVFNPNEDVASTSNTNIKDRLVIQITREFEFIKHNKTTASIVYQGRTGHAYSWVFFGDANGDGFTFNDLLYVPIGPNDPKVAWANTTERDNFFAFVNSTDLKNYMGSHPPRNSETCPWNQELDLKFTQQLPLYKNVHAELYVNLLNFWNFFNSKWGALDEIPFSYKRAVASASYNAAGNGGLGQWNYSFNGNTLNGIPTVANDTPVSRWQVEAGLRLKF